MITGILEGGGGTASLLTEDERRYHQGVFSFHTILLSYFWVQLTALINSISLIVIHWAKINI